MLSLFLDSTPSLPQALCPAKALEPSIYPVVFSIESIASGIYHYRADGHGLDLLGKVEREDFRKRYLLQHEHGDAAFMLMVSVPIKAWLEHYGDRGYRNAMMSAGFLTDQWYMLAEYFKLSYTAAGGFSPGQIDPLLGLEQGQDTVCLSFVVGAQRS